MSELRRINIAQQVIEEDSYTPEVRRKIEELCHIRKLLKEFNAIGYDCDHDEHYGNLSARVSNNEEFICTATQTSGYNKLEITYFPIVFNFINNTIQWKSVRGGKEPSVEASTHDGFYQVTKE